MHHPTDWIAHTTAFVTPVVEHWLERECPRYDPLHRRRFVCILFGLLLITEILKTSQRVTSFSFSYKKSGVYYFIYLVLLLLLLLKIPFTKRLPNILRIIA